MRGRRAYVLVMVMFISLVLIVSGMAYLSAQTRNYQAAVTTIYAAQARGLAEAGLEDARSKLEKDPRFPPPAEEGQKLFSYVETLTDIGGVGTVGSFEVSVEMSLADKPYYVAIVRSEGRLQSGESHVLRAEIDLCPFDRLDPDEPNPDAYRVVNILEEGVNL